MVEKKGKKKWYEILSTSDFNNTVIGETNAFEDKDIIGRMININLGSLTRDIKLQNIKLKFIVKEVKDNKAYTEIKSYELINNYIKRVVRVGRSRIDDSFIVKTKEGIKVKIKPLILTRYKTQNNILKELRKSAKNYLTDYIQKETYNKMISDMINKKIQKDLRNNLNKVYPVSIIEIRLMQKI